jgi:hypothetical protein
MKIRTSVLIIFAALLAACGSNRPDNSSTNLSVCEPQDPDGGHAVPDENAKKQEQQGWPWSRCEPENVFSVIFDGGKPIGIGGGTSFGGNSNNKKVDRNKAYCWVATNTDGAPLNNKKFAILFSPEDDPKKQKSWVKVKIRADLEKGIKYKYTVWSDDAGECGIIDPWFLIN